MQVKCILALVSFIWLSKSSIHRSANSCDYYNRVKGQLMEICTCTLLSFFKNIFAMTWLSTVFYFFYYYLDEEFYWSCELTFFLNCSLQEKRLQFQLMIIKLMMMITLMSFLRVCFHDRLLPYLDGQLLANIDNMIAKC